MERKAEGPMPWEPKHLHLRLAVWWGIALAWVTLGLNSDRVPYANSTFWIIACTLAGGAALGFVTRRTRQSLYIYLAAATLVGVLRSIAYLSQDAGGPSAVWAIVALSNVLIYLGYEDWRQ